MKKLLTVVCLSGLLSVPSVVFAEASWYGRIAVGVESNAAGMTGVADKGSRFGVSGSSEVSEGLTAVYQFEHKINAASASLTDGRLSYAGLSGGFGSLTFGQVWSASYNSFGAITDNSYAYGDSETAYRHGNAVSYAVSVENISIQVDALMNQSGGTTADKNVDEVHLGISMGLGENGKLALSHISWDVGTWDAKEEDYSGDDPKNEVKASSTLIAGEYNIGSMTAYLGFGQLKGTDKTAAPTTASVTMPHVTKRTNKTTFMGVRGSVADTGVSYVFQARNKKTKGTAETDDRGAKADLAADKHTPWMFGLNRSLGGGASVHFSHGNPDKKGKKSQSYLGLQVNF